MSIICSNRTDKNLILQISQSCASNSRLLRMSLDMHLAPLSQYAQGLQSNAELNQAPD